MKKTIAFVLLAALMLTGATSVYASGPSNGGNGKQQRLHSEECIQNERCLYDGEGPQDGTGLRYNKGIAKGFGRSEEHPENGLQNRECPYDGEGPKDGTGLQRQMGFASRKAERAAQCPSGSTRQYATGNRWQNN